MPYFGIYAIFLGFEDLQYGRMKKIPGKPRVFQGFLPIFGLPVLRSGYDSGFYWGPCQILSYTSSLTWLRVNIFCLILGGPFFEEKSDWKIGIFLKKPLTPPPLRKQMHCPPSMKHAVELGWKESVLFHRHIFNALAPFSNVQELDRVSSWSEEFAVSNRKFPKKIFFPQTRCPRC